VLVGAAFVIALGFGIVAPALPTFAASFNVGVTAISLVISAFAFVRLAFAPVSGALVASFGEQRVHVWGVMIVGAATVACAFAGSYWQLLAFRSLAGTGSTMFTVSAMTLLVRVAPPALRAQASGLWATSFLLGNICGPLVGGGLVELSLRLPFLVYGVTCFVAALFSWLFLRRSTLDAPVPADGASSVSVWQAVRHPAYRAALASNFATGWAVYGVRISLIPLFVTAVLHRAGALAGISLSVFAAGNAAALMVSGRLSDRRGRKPLALAGLAISAAGTSWLGFTTSVSTFLAASLIAGVGAGLLNPPQNAAVADVIGGRARSGPILAGFQMAADIGAIMGPLVAALLVDAVSYAAAFCMTGAMAVLALVVWLVAPETLPGRGRASQSPRVTESITS
jgi:MFS family permease